jgi:hypothetical protein
MERRVHGALRQVEHAAAPLAQTLDDQVPVRGLLGDDCEQERVEVSPERVRVHGRKPFTAANDT